MSRSRPFDLIYHFYRPVWESYYKGRKYRATGQDLREAKVFLTMNEDIFDDDGDGAVEFQEHAQEYLRSTWSGWKEQQHPCSGLLRNYNSFCPKKVAEQVKRIQMIACPDCGKAHKATELCPECQKVK